MVNPKQVYITIEWQEQGPLETTGHQCGKGTNLFAGGLSHQLPCNNLVQEGV
jgi:hypothetical protein